MSRPTWDETWLEVASVVAQRAACTRSQVGAVVVTPDGRHIISVGYNGAPSGEVHCTDGGCPRGALSKEDCAPGSAYGNCVAIHAECNACVRAGESAKGGILYVTREPCDWCWKVVRASGVARVVCPDGEWNF